MPVLPRFLMVFITLRHIQHEQHQPHATKGQTAWRTVANSRASKEASSSDIQYHLLHV